MRARAASVRCSRTTPSSETRSGSRAPTARSLPLLPVFHLPDRDRDLESLLPGAHNTRTAAALPRHDRQPQGRRSDAKAARAPPLLDDPDRTRVPLQGDRPSRRPADTPRPAPRQRLPSRLLVLNSRPRGGDRRLRLTLSRPPADQGPQARPGSHGCLPHPAALHALPSPPRAHGRPHNLGESRWTPGADPRPPSPLLLPFVRPGPRPRPFWPGRVGGAAPRPASRASAPP